VCLACQVKQVIQRLPVSRSLIVVGHRELWIDGRTNGDDLRTIFEGMQKENYEAGHGFSIQYGLLLLIV
jgi:hypothetical protein